MAGGFLLLHLQLMTLILIMMMDQKVCYHSYRKMKVGRTAILIVF
jgi:hypothetical protein